MKAKSYVPFLVHCPIFGTLKITRIVFSFGYRAAAEVLLFSGVLAVSSGFIRHDSCSDFRMRRRESSVVIFMVVFVTLFCHFKWPFFTSKNSKKNFFKKGLTKLRRRYTMVVSEGGQEPRGRRKNYDRFGTIYQRM